VEFVVVKFRIIKDGLKAFQSFFTRNIPLNLHTHTFIYHRRYTNVEVEGKDNNAHKIKLDKALKEKTLNSETLHQIKSIFSHELSVSFPFQKRVSK